MHYFVENCFHWMAYHIVDHLLLKGCHVDGADELDTDYKDHLSMFVGRHEAFRHVTSSQRCTSYDVHIQMNDQTLLLHKRNGFRSALELPIVFGEWMPMNQQGMYWQGDFIRFDSQRFLSEAVYVKQLSGSVWQWSRADQLPANLYVRAGHNQRDIKDLDKTIYIRHHRPIEQQLRQVKDHYHMYRAFYPCH